MSTATAAHDILHKDEKVVEEVDAAVSVAVKEHVGELEAIVKDLEAEIEHLKKAHAAEKASLEAKVEELQTKVYELVEDRSYMAP